MFNFLKAFWKKVDVKGPDECWPWLGANLPSGYGRVGLRGITTTAHRVAYEITTGHEIPERLYGCHSCDNPPCCNPKHIFPGTGGDNQKDSISKGRRDPVIRTIDGLPGHRSLDPDTVKHLRHKFSQLPPKHKLKACAQAATEYGVSPRTIYKAVSGITWNQYLPQQEATEQ